jgi:hypothetical protein
MCVFVSVIIVHIHTQTHIHPIYIYINLPSHPIHTHTHTHTYTYTYIPLRSTQTCVSWCPAIGEFPEFGIYDDAVDMGAVTIEGNSYEDWQVRVCVCGWVCSE